MANFMCLAFSLHSVQIDKKRRRWSVIISSNGSRHIIWSRHIIRPFSTDFAKWSHYSKLLQEFIEGGGGGGVPLAS